ncbi:hypothetical protein BOTCAL_0632g00010 [Botryotinia calthae]|uniref:Uncharacterized protein n=1 Tax=Botryotinia calthae TaxID=38488 RepID=A0A4Y8CKG3_9HELO|nr:hypothetical protein BOTCAL_0632g00010 [Botryotinia calthae]
MCVVVKLQTEASVLIPNQKPESPTEIEYIEEWLCLQVDFFGDTEGSSISSQSVRCHETIQ